MLFEVKAENDSFQNYVHSGILALGKADIQSMKLILSEPFKQESECLLPTPADRIMKR